jgi:hypothetical protein
VGQVPYLKMLFHSPFHITRLANRKRRLPPGRINACGQAKDAFVYLR